MIKYIYSGSNKNNDGREVIIDEETEIWLARMCEGEGAGSSRVKSQAMIQAMLNRYFLFSGRHHWPTFLYMVRRFSQPINPEWRRGGRLARKYAGTEHCTERKFRERERISELDWDDITPEIAIVVGEFIVGRAPWELNTALQKIKKKRISNWASYRGIKKKFPHGIALGPRLFRRRNWFFEDENLIDGEVITDTVQNEIEVGEKYEMTTIFSVTEDAGNGIFICTLDDGSQMALPRAAILQTRKL